jgi:hypothetical protein
MSLTDSARVRAAAHHYPLSVIWPTVRDRMPFEV